jgi:hypothetical protein
LITSVTFFAKIVSSYSAPSQVATVRRAPSKASVDSCDSG